MITPEVNRDVLIITHPCRKLIILKVENNDDKKSSKKFWGFHISRSKWDPYPWVGYVETGSIADLAGLRAGDCLLDIEGNDLIGLRVKEIASMMEKKTGNILRLQVWRSLNEEELESSEVGEALKGPLPEVAKKLAKAVSGTVKALECPVCLESADSPVSQCVHGHIICVGCRSKTPRCPVCRVRLGQGRCLLADQVQRNIREAFDESPDINSSTNSSLRERLFGKSTKKPSHSDEPSNRHSRSSSTKFGSSIARLLLGGFDKAASAENLSVATISEGNRRMNPGSQAAYKRLGELSQYDRTKSASTGELSKGEENPTNSSIYQRCRNIDRTSVSGLLSVPETPTWGNSIESINNSLLPCPLARTTQCREFTSRNLILEHLANSHDGAQIHFYGKIARIPLPLPFGLHSSYILRHRGELFFFQQEKEKFWITSTSIENPGEWSLLGKNDDGTEIKLRKLVAKLEDNSTLLPCNFATLPKSLNINIILVELLDSQNDDGVRI